MASSQLERPLLPVLLVGGHQIGNACRLGRAKGLLAALGHHHPVDAVPLEGLGQQDADGAPTQHDGAGTGARCHELDCVEGDSGWLKEGSVKRLDLWINGVHIGSGNHHVACHGTRLAAADEAVVLAEAEVPRLTIRAFHAGNQRDAGHRLAQELGINALSNSRHNTAELVA